MILVDTSIWVDHLRRADARLADALQAQRVFVHPLITGELACGFLRNRGEILGLLQRMPQAPEASHSEALAFLEGNGLAGVGMGIVDVHLLASAALGGDIRLWTKDRRLRLAAQGLNLAYSP